MKKEGEVEEAKLKGGKVEGSFVSTERQEDDVGAAGNAEQKWEARNENNNAGKAKDEGPSMEESVSEYTFLSQHDHRR